MNQLRINPFEVIILQIGSETLLSKAQQFMNNQINIITDRIKGQWKRSFTILLTLRSSFIKFKWLQDFHVLQSLNSQQVNLQNMLDYMQSGIKITSKGYELAAGQCCPDQQLSFNIDIPYELSYPKVKLSINVIMQSANGRIPAGKSCCDILLEDNLALIEPNISEIGAQKYLPVLKCPDKTASITLSYASTFIQSHKKKLETNPLKVSSCKSVQSPKPSYVSNYNNKNEKASYQPKGKLFLNNSRKKESPQSPIKNSQFDDSKDDQFSQDNQQSPISYLHSKSRAESQLNNLKKQKNIYRQSIAKAKKELYTSKNEDKARLYEARYQRLQFQNQNLISEISQYKDKIRQLQRKQRDSFQNIKQLKQKLQKLTAKSSVRQNANQDIILASQEKQQKIRHLENQLKNLKEELQDYKMNFSIQEKKMNIKQANFNEQLQRLTEKCKKNESERQKATHQLSQLLNEFETNEKKHQILAKQRGLQQIEEKNKMVKKIDELTKNNEFLTENLFEIKNKKSEVQLLYKFTLSSKEQVLQEYNKAKQQIQELKDKLKKTTHTNHQQETQLIQLRQIKTEYLNLNKKYSNLKEQHHKLKQNYNHTSDDLKAAKNNKKQLDKKISEYAKQKQIQIYEFMACKQKLNESNKLCQAHEEEIRVIKEANMQLTAKIGEMKKNYDENRLQHHQMLNKLQSQLVFLNKLKQHDEIQAEQLKLKLQKSNESVQAQTKTINQLNNIKVILNEEIIKIQEKYQSSQKEGKQLENSIQIMKENMKSLEVKEKQYAKQIKVRTEKEYELKKNLQQKQKDIFILKEKLTQQQSQYSTKLEELETRLKENSEVIDKIQEHNRDLTTKLDQLIKDRDEKQAKFVKLSQKNKQYNENIQQLDQVKLQLENSNKMLNEKVLELQSDQKNNIEKISLLNKKLDEKSKSYDKLLEQQSATKSHNHEVMKSFQKFFSKSNELFGNQSSDKTIQIAEEVILFKEQFLSEIQQKIMNNYLKKLTQNEQQKKTTNKQHNYKILELQNSIKIIEVQKTEVQNLLEKQKQLNKQKSASFFANNNVLKNENASLGQKIYELQIEKDKQQKQIEALKQANQSLEKKEINLSGLKNKLEEENQLLTTSKQLLIKQKEQIIANSQSQQSKLLNESQVQSEKLRQTVRILKQKIQGLKLKLDQQHQKQAHQQQLKKQLLFNIDKLQKKSKEDKQRQTDLNTQIQSVKQKLQQRDQQLYDANEVLEKQRGQLKIANNKIAQLQQKMANQRRQIKEAQSSIVKYKSQIDALKHQIQFYEQEINTLHQQRKKIDKSFMNENKSMESKLLAQKTDLQLKIFEIKQLKETLFLHQQQKLSLNLIIDDKKGYITKIQSEKQLLQNQISFIHQNSQNLVHEKESLELENSAQKETIAELNLEMEEKQQIIDLLEQKELELQRLHEKYSSLNNQFDKSNQSYKIALNKYDLQLKQSRKKEGELRSVVKQLQDQLEAQVKQFEANSSSKLEYMQKKYAKEKQDLHNAIEVLENTQKQLKSQLDLVRQQYNLEIEQYREECNEIRDLLNQKQDIIQDQEENIKQNDNRIKLLSLQLKNCLEAWELEKNQLRQRKSSSRVSVYENPLINTSKSSIYMNQSDHQESMSNSEQGKDYEKIIDDLSNRGKRLLQKYKERDCYEQLKTSQVKSSYNNFSPKRQDIQNYESKGSPINSQ